MVARYHAVCQPKRPLLEISALFAVPEQAQGSSRSSASTTTRKPSRLFTSRCQLNYLKVNPGFLVLPNAISERDPQRLSILLAILLVSLVRRPSKNAHQFDDAAVYKLNKVYNTNSANCHRPVADYPHNTRATKLWKTTSALCVIGDIWSPQSHLSLEAKISFTDRTTVT